MPGRSIRAPLRLVTLVCGCVSYPLGDGALSVRLLGRPSTQQRGDEKAVMQPTGTREAVSE